MNIFRKIGCRIYQLGFRFLLPFLPYRRPKLLNNNAQVVELFKTNNVNTVILVTDTSIYKLDLTKPLEDELKKANINCIVYDKTVPNPTIENIEEALALYKQNNCQAIIAFGGGSSMDCAKMVGARVANPQKSVEDMKGLLKVRGKMPLLIAVPTTAGTGSETTLAAVITNPNTKSKYAINDFHLIPPYALLDENLTVGLPQSITSTTGMDALTHAIEAYIGKSTTHETRDCALRACKLIFENLEYVYNNPTDKTARKNMLNASFLAGVAFTKSYVGYVHAVAHSLGGEYRIAHGLANAVILPVMLKEYGKTVQKKLKQIAVYCGLASKEDTSEQASKNLIKKIEQMNKNMGIPNNLEGIKDEDIPKLAHHADKEANPLYPVPKLYNAKELEKIYHLIKRK